MDVNSEQGKGTTFTLKIPLTTAIIDGMLMRVHNSIYSIPTQDIKESIHISNSKMISLFGGREIIKVRDKIIPILRLNEIHNISSDDKEEGIVVIAENGNGEVGFFVDEILGQRQMVLKSLSRYADNIKGVSGVAVLGNGEICLILDLAALVKIAETSVKDISKIRTSQNIITGERI